MEVCRNPTRNEFLKPDDPGKSCKIASGRVLESQFGPLVLLYDLYKENMYRITLT